MLEHAIEAVQNTMRVHFLQGICHMRPNHKILNSKDFWLCDRDSLLPLCFYVNTSNVPSAWLAQRDELREIFNDISSSSEDEEDEGDRHEDEDLNIMDTEDDLVRQLHEKLDESDSAQHESDRNSQIGEMISGFVYKQLQVEYLSIPSAISFNGGEAD